MSENKSSKISPESGNVKESKEYFYPEIEPFDSFYFRVDETHELYVEQVGNPKGKPALFLHGGPGAGATPTSRRFFDPQTYRIIIFDQRGCGRSRPFASLQNNTTWDLIADIEKLRTHLQIDKWLVFGGSWGSTLSLAYAETHPERVTELVLRGIFLCREEEIQWFYQKGASFLFPQFWQNYVEPIPENERGDLLQAFYRRLSDEENQAPMRRADGSVEASPRMLSAARAWSAWEASTLHLHPDMEEVEIWSQAHKCLPIARIESHYFKNKAFFEADGQLLRNVGKIRHIPTTIIHGRYDVVCPIKNAYDLKAVFPEAELIVVPDAGHAGDEPGIKKALVATTDRLRKV